MGDAKHHAVLQAASPHVQAMRNSGADEVIIPEYEGGLMTGRMISNVLSGADESAMMG
jgi:hypothetical protein